MQENEEKKPFKNKNFYDALNNAISGIIYAFKTQRNLKFQYIIAVILLFLTMFVKMEKLEFVILIMTISIVLVTELLNTAIEKTVDLFVDVYHPIAKIAKDVSAGAVVVACFNSIIIGFFLFSDKLYFATQNILTSVLNTQSYFTITILLIVTIGIVVIKSLLNKGTPLEGGMPSGHTAISFALLTLVTVYTKNVYVFTLTFFIAFLVAQSRYQSKVHKLSEVIFGAFYGVVTVLLAYYVVILKGSGIV